MNAHSHQPPYLSAFLTSHNLLLISPSNPPHICHASPIPFSVSMKHAHKAKDKHNDPSTSAKPSSSPYRRLANSRPTKPHIDTGNITFMAIAAEFSMSSLSRRLHRCKNEYGGLKVSANGSVLRLAKLGNAQFELAEAFVFPYGCMVVWGTQQDSDDFLSLVVEDAVELRSSPAVDNMHYVYGEHGSLKRDVITLETRIVGTDDDADYLDPVLQRMAISCGLAQSIKLGAFEAAMRATIENTGHLPEQLASTGEITASRREVSRLMGQLFLDRYRYHLSGDLLMTPAFFWENEQYLPSYRRVERYLELRERGDVLNKRVEVVQELYQLLGEELNNQNSAALELAITLMIAFEILLTLITLAQQSMRSVFSAFALFVVIATLGLVLWRIYRRRRSSKMATKYPERRRKRTITQEF